MNITSGNKTALLGITLIFLAFLVIASPNYLEFERATAPLEIYLILAMLFSFLYSVDLLREPEPAMYAVSLVFISLCVAITFQSTASLMLALIVISVTWVAVATRLQAGLLGTIVSLSSIIFAILIAGSEFLLGFATPIIQYSTVSTIVDIRTLLVAAIIVFIFGSSILDAFGEGLPEAPGIGWEKPSATKIDAEQFLAVLAKIADRFFYLLWLLSVILDTCIVRPAMIVAKMAMRIGLKFYLISKNIFWQSVLSPKLWGFIGLLFATIFYSLLIKLSSGPTIEYLSSNTPWALSFGIGSTVALLSLPMMIAAVCVWLFATIFAGEPSKYLSRTIEPLAWIWTTYWIVCSLLHMITYAISLFATRPDWGLGAVGPIWAVSSVSLAILLVYLRATVGRQENETSS